MTRSSTTASMRASSWCVSRAIAASPPSAITAFIAEPAHHVFQKPPLHRVIIDDQNTLNHTQPRTDTTRVPIWGSVTELR